jgi:hypothetical protein
MARRRRVPARHRGLASLIPVNQILFGSDFPYRPLGESADSMSQLGLPEADQYAIGRNNALALLPWLKAGCTCRGGSRVALQFAAGHESAVGTFRTWRGVRVKSVVRTKADVARLRDVSDVPNDESAL